MTDIAVFEKEMVPFIKQAQEVVITSLKDMTGAVSFLSTLNKKLDTIVAEKERVTKPLNEALKAERARWKPFETQLESAIESVRSAMMRYQTTVAQQAREKEAKIMARMGEGKGHIKVETAVRKLGEIERADEHVSTDAGSVRFREARRFEVVDIVMLPMQFHLADEVKIRKTMTEGVELPGVRYWVEQVPYNTR
jgi:hypothetical protein